jgi:polyisoprenoid-binding protein YceI
VSGLDSAAGASVPPPGVWSIDAGRSSVTFAVRHVLATLHGCFSEFEGTLEVAPNGVAKGFGTVNAASIDTGEPTRDERLRRSADFFDIERCPTITFASTRIDHLNSGRFLVVGDLTMRGVTRELELHARAHGPARDAGGNQSIALELRGELSRREFGLTWNQALETGGMLVGDRVKIALDLSGVQTQATRPAV